MYSYIVAVRINIHNLFRYYLGVTSPKVCILLLDLRIFTDRKARIATWAVMGIVVANFIFNG